ncbi:MAG TPA: RecX family transcriptional regulator [Candidatus Dojkabacteria bacterium]|nr:RecX family transcriptional regulator [Candidatus Dojkabacteria bacterium]HRO64694.1 RecX family transcriptional regulator [Candidatus Dojkabacteria bacterium]HRP50706.1 RecX family transcriptional regulator [Candidatus Dojkabacteria bacterium]
MKITRLKRGVRNAQKIAIYVDSKYTFSVLESILVDENLYIDKEITEEDLDRIKDLTESLELKVKLINLISRRPRSEREIQQYLLKQNIKDNKGIIETLKNEGYIDDTKFTEWWIDQRVAFKNRSINEIRSELLGKGISNDIIENAIGEADMTESELKSIKLLAEKKKSLLKHKKLTTEQLNEKVVQFLLRKGFRWELIQKALEK